MEKVEMTTLASVPPTAPARDVPEGGCCVRLSEHDAEQVLQAADNPPVPNAAAVAAARRLLQHG